MKKLLLPSAILLLVLTVQCAKEPGDFGGGTSRPTCQSAAVFDGSLWIQTVRLMYDYNAIDMADRIYFNSIHQNSINASGVISYLEDIVTDASDALEETHKGYIKAVFSGTDCTGSVEYTVSNQQNCVGNRLSKIPNIGIIANVIFEIKSAKNPSTNKRIGWGATVQGPHIYILEADGEYAIGYNGVAYTKYEPGSVSYRIASVDNYGTITYEPVHNTYYSTGTHKVGSGGGDMCEEQNQGEGGIWIDGERDGNIDWEEPYTECS